MKKILWIILILFLIICIRACTESATCNHEWTDATCTTPKTCSLCKETSGIALGHTTNIGTCSRCGTTFSAWQIEEYTDEFNQPTGKKYMYSKGSGTFNNLLNANSKLTAAIYVDSSRVGIMLWHYGSTLVKGIMDEGYNITILDENGTKHYYSTVQYANEDCIYFRSRNTAEIIDLLTNNDKLQIYIESEFSSTYLFTIDTVDFESFYSQIV